MHIHRKTRIDAGILLFAYLISLLINTTLSGRINPKILMFISNLEIVVATIFVIILYIKVGKYGWLVIKASSFHEKKRQLPIFEKHASYFGRESLSFIYFILGQSLLPELLGFIPGISENSIFISISCVIFNLIIYILLSYYFLYHIHRN